MDSGHWDFEVPPLGPAGVEKDRIICGLPGVRDVALPIFVSSEDLGLIPSTR